MIITILLILIMILITMLIMIILMCTAEGLGKTPSADEADRGNF